MYRNGRGYPFIQSTKKKASSRTYGGTKVNSNAPGLLHKNDALELLQKNMHPNFCFRLYLWRMPYCEDLSSV